MNKIDDLESEIRMLREKLNDLARTGVSPPSDRLLELSRQLDELINSYMKALQAAEPSSET